MAVAMFAEVIRDPRVFERLDDHAILYNNRATIYEAPLPYEKDQLAVGIGGYGRVGYGRREGKLPNLGQVFWGWVCSIAL